MLELRPKRTVTASSKLLDPTNTAKHDLTSHRHAIEAKRAAESNQQDATNTLPTRDSGSGSEAQLSTPTLSSNPLLLATTENSDLISAAPVDNEDESGSEDQPITTHRKY